MTFDHDDPRWTAYVLGESDAKDRAELEAILAASPEARAHVDSLREAIALIEVELVTKPAPVLDDLARKRIEAAAAVPVAKPKRRRARWLAAGASAAAIAAVVFAVKTNSADMAEKQNRYVVDSERSSEHEGLKLNLPAGQTTELAQVDRLEKTLEIDGKERYDVQTRLQELKQKRQFAYQQNAVTAQPGPLGNIDGVDPNHNTEAYAKVDDNPFHRVAQDPLSTFSADVDTASYANIRRFLESGQRPPKDAVRIEEMINYFRYSYPAPQGTDPFSITTEVGPSPWNAKHQLVRIGIQSPVIPDSQVPARNLVFLIDTSGSMQTTNKLPLLVQSLGMLVENLRPQDRVSIVAYAGAAGLVLSPTSDRGAIRSALSRLEAGGSTNGGEGIVLAYKTAHEHFVKGAINRVILCSDGDMNVGVTSEGDLTRLIEKERETGVFLTVLGFGMGNLKDSTMEKLADRGNGNYAYIDSLFEARKVLVKEAGATLVTVAKDVKLQVEFNPTAVAGYRLIGYENRVMANQDFNDDKKDAGDIGAGHSVTALYEIVPAGVDVPSTKKVDDLKYQTPTAPTGASDELMTVKIRYKAPDGTTSKLLSRPVKPGAKDLKETSVDFRWATAISGFGMLLRESAFRGNLSWQQVQSLAEGALGDDAEGYRKQALQLIGKASRLPATTP